MNAREAGAREHKRRLGRIGLLQAFIGGARHAQPEQVMAFGVGGALVCRALERILRQGADAAAALAEGTVKENRLVHVVPDAADAQCCHLLHAFSPEGAHFRT